jgi:hypothetical protein
MASERVRGWRRLPYERRVLLLSLAVGAPARVVKQFGTVTEPAA